MLVKEFAQAILDASLCLEDSVNTQTPYLVKLESDLSFGAFKSFLLNFRNNEAIFNVSYANRFADFLSQRWQFTKYTDSSLLLNQKTLINRSCISFAINLYKSLSEISSAKAEDFFYFLMPTLMTMYGLDRKAISQYKLHELVLGDNGEAIDIKKCLDKAAKDKTIQLYHTNQPNKILSASERERVIHHSNETENYYDAICFYVNTSVKNDMFAAANNLTQALDGNDYEITYTYGAQGNKRLVNYCMTFAKSPNEFASIMQKISQDNWIDFIKQVSDKDLQRLLVNSPRFNLNVQNPKLYSGKLVLDRSIAFALCEVYIRQRDCGETFTSKFGYFTAQTQKYLGSYVEYIRSYTKEEKIAAVEELQRFLASGEPLSEIENYFKDEKRKQFYGPLFEKGSDAACLVEQIKNLVTHSIHIKKPVLNDKNNNTSVIHERRILLK